MPHAASKMKKQTRARTPLLVTSAGSDRQSADTCSEHRAPQCPCARACCPRPVLPALPQAVCAALRRAWPAPPWRMPASYWPTRAYVWLVHAPQPTDKCNRRTSAIDGQVQSTEGTPGTGRAGANDKGKGEAGPSPTLSPTDPVPRGLLTLCPGAY